MSENPSLLQTLNPNLNPDPNPHSTSLSPLPQDAAPSRPLLSSVPIDDGDAFPYRFQRTDLWKPVYRWLESLDLDTLVNGKDVSDWLLANPEITQELFAKHSRSYMVHYTQRMHLKMLKKKGKMPKGIQLSAARAGIKTALNNSGATREVSVPRKILGSGIRENKTSLLKNKEAFLRYELLTDLQNQLTSVLLKQKHTASHTDSNAPDSLVTKGAENYKNVSSSDMGKNNVNMQAVVGDNYQRQVMGNIHSSELSLPKLPLEPYIGPKRNRNPIIVTPAWSYNETLSGCQIDPQSSSCSEEARKLDIWKGDAHPSTSHMPLSHKNILKCLQGREKGLSWSWACSQGAYVGRNREKWIPFFKGWRSLENQFDGPSVQLTRRYYSSWVPTWCAYTSSAANAQPNVRGVQKVLNVRFEPGGLPQLVCCSSEAPNEILLYNLLSGRAVQLTGHNCQIEAVDFAARGASIVSCGSNLLKIWDCTTGSCLFTLGSTVGHTQKISSMAVNSWQSCLVVTSSAKGDEKLLLWNALRGELAADLNSHSRSSDLIYPSIVKMGFISENILACGSDCEYGGPAVVQLWDIDSPESCITFPANDSYITSLNVNPGCNTLITGAGDGSIGLFDVRTSGVISHLSVGSGYEVTSVSFSNCGAYFSASSTSNNTLVWDMRILPAKGVQLQREMSSEGCDMRFFRPLHCLSHGMQMPTAEHPVQLPRHVDEGDQGVNDVKWLQREPVLITASGDGSIAMWDVTLGQPCIRHIVSHTRCVNTVAVAPNDEYLCTGGDDQKIVLYRNKSGISRQKWRLSHPLEEAS